jgi:hypothetical protein
MVVEIDSFSRCRRYISQTGVVCQPKLYPGSSQSRMDEIYAICDRILEATGQHSWYHDEFKPFTLHYQRSYNRLLVWIREGANTASIPIEL